MSDRSRDHWVRATLGKGFSFLYLIPDPPSCFFRASSHSPSSSFPSLSLPEFYYSLPVRWDGKICPAPYWLHRLTLHCQPRYALTESCMPHLHSPPPNYDFGAKHIFIYLQLWQLELFGSVQGTLDKMTLTDLQCVLGLSVDKVVPWGPVSEVIPIITLLLHLESLLNR